MRDSTLSKVLRLIDTIMGYKYWATLSFKCRKGMAGPKSCESDKRKLLLLAWEFPPTVTGGVYRPLSFVKYGVEYGWKISVISGPAPEIQSETGEYLVKRVPQEVFVYQLCPEKTYRIIPISKLFPRVNGGFLNALHTISLGQKELRDDPPSIVMASGPPFHTFIAAYYLARFFKAKLILDYRDEWSECPFNFVQPGYMDRKWESLLLGQADLVFFTTKLMLEHQVKTFRNLKREKCMAIPNGWEPKDFMDGGKFEVASISQETERFLVSFIGTLGDHCLPGNFLKTLETVLERRKDILQNLKIQFVGARSTNADKQLHDFKFPSILDIKDEVPKNIANHLMKKASALLLFYDERFARYIPGKFYDYLKAGVPMIVTGERGEVVNIARTLKAGFVVRENDPDTLERILESLVKGNYSNCNRMAIEQWLEPLTRQKISQRVFETLDCLMIEG